MATQALTTPAQVLRLVPNTGPNSHFWKLIRDYREAAEEARMKQSVFEVEFKRLAKTAKVNKVLEREIIEMQDAHRAKDGARDMLLWFIDGTF